jgi:hypothetical protein
VKTVVQPNSPQMTVRHMRIACWVTKSTNTHSDYVIVIAFLLQQWLHELASILRSTCIACPVSSTFYVYLNGLSPYSSQQWHYNIFSRMGEGGEGLGFHIYETLTLPVHLFNLNSINFWMFSNLIYYALPVVQHVRKVAVQLGYGT